MGISASSARSVSAQAGQPDPLHGAAVVPVDHHGAAIQRAGVHHPGADLAGDAGHLLESDHRVLGGQIGEMLDRRVRAPGSALS